MPSKPEVSEGEKQPSECHNVLIFQYRVLTIGTVQEERLFVLHHAPEVIDVMTFCSVVLMQIFQLYLIPLL